jgi:hypothetical protein
MIDQRDSLAREVDEELRREQLLRLWEKYGTYLVAAVALIVIGVGGVKYYQYRTTVASEAAGSRLAEATRRPVQESAEAQKILQEIGSSGPGGYATLAKLRLAAAEREAGRLNEAIAAYEAIAKQGGDRLLADYARLQAASLKVDSAGWTDMQNRLNDLAADGNPWRASARELLGLAAMKAGKIEEAREQFQRLLSDRDTPPSISERARIMMAMLTEKELSTPATPPAAAPSESTKSK